MSMQLGSWESISQLEGVGPERFANIADKRIIADGDPLSSFGSELVGNGPIISASNEAAKPNEGNIRHLVVL